MSYAGTGMVPFGPHLVSVTTEVGKELAKFERKADYKPSANPFPKMLYRAYKGGDGVVRCMDGMPNAKLYPNTEAYRRACQSMEEFNISCQMTVGTESEQAKAEADGWRESPSEASDAIFAQERAIGEAAAWRANQDKNMSEKAQAEVAAAEASTPEILADIPTRREVIKVDGRTKEGRALKGVTYL